MKTLTHALLNSVLTLSFIASLAPSANAEAIYSFKEMNCTGYKDPGQYSADFSYIALKIKDSNQNVTDILGQTHAYPLQWSLSFGSSIDQALASAARGQSSDSSTPRLAIDSTPMGRSRVFRLDHYTQQLDLNLILNSSNGNVDHFTGQYFNRTDIPRKPYVVNCQAVR